MNSKMRNAKPAVWLISLISLAALAGCFSLGRTEPPQRIYVLGGDLLRPSGAPSAALAGLKIGVRRLRLAGYLDPPLIAVRHGPSQIRYSEYHRWGEPVGMGINRAVAGYLSARAAFGTVDVAPWPPRERYDYVVQLNVERFEGLVPEDSTATEGEAHVLVAWEIVRQQDGEVLARGATEHRESGWILADYTGLVRSLNAGLDILSRDLVASLESLTNRSTALPGGNAAPP